MTRNQAIHLFRLWAAGDLKFLVNNSSIEASKIGVLTLAENKTNEVKLQPTSYWFFEVSPELENISFITRHNETREINCNIKESPNINNPVIISTKREKNNMISIMFTFSKYNKFSKTVLLINPQGKVVHLSFHNVGYIPLYNGWVEQNDSGKYYDPICEGIKILNRQLIALSTSYKTTKDPFHPIQVLLLLSDLENNPLPHLEKFAHCVLEARKTVKDPKCQINLLGQSKVYDYGGVARHFITTMMGSIPRNLPKLFKKNEADHYIPQILLKPIKIETKDHPFSTYKKNEESEKVYYNIGVLSMYCHESRIEKTGDNHWDNTYWMGDIFPPEIFNAISSLTLEEISTSIEKMKTETVLKLFNSFTSETGKNQLHGTLCQSLSHLGPFDDSILENILASLEAADRLPSEWGSLGSYNLEEVRAKEDVLKFKMMDALLNYINPKTEVSFGSLIPALLFLARGVLAFLDKDAKNWNAKYSKQSPTPLSPEKIQGEFSREAIVESLEMGDMEGNNRGFIKERVDWIEYWLEKEATPPQLRQFIKLSTGSSSILKGKKIQIIAQSSAGASPFCVGVTCLPGIKLADIVCKSFDFTNNNRDAFIKSLIESLRHSEEFSAD